MLNWEKINFVLLDMDGTLLDLHFDNFFWHSHIPSKYAQAHNVSLVEAQKYLHVETSKVSGEIEWYCLDYWTDKLDLPIVELKKEIQHKIALRPDTLPFLAALKAAKKQVVLLTNAHPDSLSLKVERTALDQHIDVLISTHRYGATKESQVLWQKLQADLKFDNDSTLFVDDSLTILNSAKKFGIQHLLAVANPDSTLPSFNETHLKGYSYITDYRNIIADII
ncbi:GMP/IMP nucleotidase [Colwellia sp. 20A7]|jgi:putative hydrolase of the HAD superfamily|uniref:GMP/IMP nucleotidase n=1 Tax=Colwellia sp. 20A7 TaxID=2689569 RepID=UPI00135AB357|nr:GMP/IMP nucleotidase [Colwellia sp. 20A7]